MYNYPCIFKATSFMKTLLWSVCSWSCNIEHK